MSNAETSKFLDKTLEFFLSSDTKKYIVLLLLIGFILRLTVASHVAPLADEMIHGVNSINIISSGVINAQNESPAWLYLTDIFYKIFGVHAFSARFVSILFGSLTIIVVYLISKELFNEKVALVSSILFTFSAYYIRYTLMEMDQAMMFFLLLAFYYFDRGMRKNNQISYISVVLAGIAILIKPITLPFIASFGLCYILCMYQNKKSELSKKHPIKYSRIANAILILLLFTAPILVYNYILYDQKGITDVIFSRFLGINQQVYSSLQGYDKTFVLSEIFTLGVPEFTKSYLLLDPIIFIIGLAGLLLVLFNKKYSQARMLIYFHIIPLIFLLGTSLLQTHLSVFVPLFCILGSVLINEASSKISVEKNRKITVLVAVGIVILVNLWLILPQISSTSGMFQLREYANTNINQRDIVAVDARMYRGRIAWTFNDKSYLESSYLPQLLNANENSTGQKYPTTLYFIECAPDDCGWGTIKDQPDFNKSVEEMVSFFKQNAPLETTIYGGGGYDEKTGEPNIRIYKTQINFDQNLYSAIYNTHDWFYYPVRWAKNDWYDKYTPVGVFQRLIQEIGVMMLWLAVVLALASPILLIREFLQNSQSTIR